MSKRFVYYITLHVTVRGTWDDSCVNDNVPLYRNIRDVPYIILERFN